MDKRPGRGGTTPFERMRAAPAGYNIRIPPRGDELVSFPQLRALADAHTLTRLCVETRKDQIEKFTWNIIGIDPELDISADPRVAELRAFFKYPDRRRPWKAGRRLLRGGL